MPPAVIGALIVAGAATGLAASGVLTPKPPDLGQPDVSFDDDKAREDESRAESARRRRRRLKRVFTSPQGAALSSTNLGRNRLLGR